MTSASTTRLQDSLREAIERHGVPGAVVAVLDGDEVTEAAAGVLSVETGVDATVDSLFQIGSMTKVWTATMLMQLVDAGRIDLHLPIKSYLPDFCVADREATETITPWHLLTHTSGLLGDYWPEFGRGDDCLRLFVESLCEVGQVAPPGRFPSYCNSGFILAGRLIEVLTGSTWDDAVRSCLAERLRLTHTVTLPEDAILYRAASGHLPGPTGEMVVRRPWSLSRWCGPAGLIVSTARDVLSFARMHMEAGRSSEGANVLSPAMTSAMQEPQVALPVPAAWAGGFAWGLGWALYDWSGTRVVGHDGNTVGQMAFLRMIPERRYAVCLLTNAPTGALLYRDLVVRLFADRFGIAPPPPLTPAKEPLVIDLAKLAGTYDRIDMETLVHLVDGALKVKITPRGYLPAISAPIPDLALQAVDDTTFLVMGEVPVIFLEFDPDGRPAYVNINGQVHRRIS